MSSLIYNRKDNDERYYTKTQTDSLLNGKSDKNHTHPSETILTNQNLNNVTTPGFYYSARGGTVTNKPSGVNHFGLEVIHRAAGSYYTQKLYTDDSQYTRQCVNGTWGNWTKDKLTDTTYTNFVKSGSGAKSGLVPAPSTTAGTTKYLREDGNWSVPPDTTSFLPIKGGTLQGNITFPEIGNTATSYGLSWSGSTDGAGIYYQTTGTDQGHLVLNMTDDTTVSTVFAFNGVHKSWVDANGSYTTSSGAAFPCDGNVYVNSPNNNCVGYLSNLLNEKLSTSASCNKNWNWSGQGGQPTWVWGGEDGTNMYVYNPSNFSVNIANWAKYVYATSHIGTWYLNSNWDGTYFQTNFKYGGSTLPINVNHANAAHDSVRVMSYPNSSTYIEANDGAVPTFAVWNASTGTGVSGYKLGEGNARWSQLYAQTATISTSDRNLKKDINSLTDTHLNFFLKLQPVSFLFKDGSSGRTHIGFIAQDVEQAMQDCGLTELDFAGFCKDKKCTSRIDEETGDIIHEPILDENGNEQYIYSLRYEEFIALNTYAIQKLYKKYNDLEEKYNKLENKINDIVKKINKEGDGYS